MFDTPRLHIRAYDGGGGDLDLLVSLGNDLEIQKLMSPEHIVPQGPKFRKTIESWADNALFFGIITRRFQSPGERLGNVAIKTVSAKNREGALAIKLALEHWGKGYGTEVLECVIDHAFNNLALHRLSLGVFGNNERAAATYRKLGFVEEGRSRKAVWIDGAWHDVILMAILEDEWMETRAKQAQDAKA